MLYSETRYPDVMKQLPEDVRRTAIEITNDMLLDGDVRHHEDLIILIAIQKAKQLIKERSELNSNWGGFLKLMQQSFMEGQYLTHSGENSHDLTS